MQPDDLSFYEHSDGGVPLSIVSVPLEIGSDARGLAAAPEYLFEQGLRDAAAAAAREVVSEHIVAVDKPKAVVSAGRMKYGREIADVAKRTKKIVEASFRREETVVALGGDHSMAIGSIAGAAAAHRSLGVVWIDAHPDCNTDETTITGNVHGMVASALMGFGHPMFTELVTHSVAPENFLYIGLKDMDQAEIDFLRRGNIARFTMLDIAARGLSPLFDAIQKLSRRVERMWISMDMDSIDKEFAPGVGMPNCGGLTRREALAIAQYVGKTCDVAGIDIVEMLPARDVEGKTAGLALEIAARFLGGGYDWYGKYIEQYRETNVTEALTPAQEREA